MEYLPLSGMHISVPMPSSNWPFGHMQMPCPSTTSYTLFPGQIHVALLPTNVFQTHACNHKKDVLSNSNGHNHFKEHLLRIVHRS